MKKTIIISGIAIIILSATIFILNKKGICCKKKTKKLTEKQKTDYANQLGAKIINDDDTVLTEDIIEDEEPDLEP